MKNILVPVDFSETSIEAFKFAINIGRKSGGKITVLHAVDLPVMTYGASIDMPVYTYDFGLLNDLKASALSRYQKMHSQFGGGFKDIKILIEQGPAFPVIRNSIRNKRYDLVVMGTHGASGLREFFVGSNTEKVVRFSKAPVFAIRKSIPTASIKNLVFPTSLETGQSDFIYHLKLIQRFFKARLHLLYLNTPFNFVRDNEVQSFVKQHKLTNCTINIRHDRYERDGILSFIKEIKADLLAMPTHARKGFAHLIYGSITEDVVNHVECPIWTYALKHQ